LSIHVFSSEILQLSVGKLHTNPPTFLCTTPMVRTLNVTQRSWCTTIRTSVLTYGALQMQITSYLLVSLTDRKTKIMTKMSTMMTLVKMIIK